MITTARHERSLLHPAVKVLPRRCKLADAYEARKRGISSGGLSERTLADHVPAVPDEDSDALAMIERWISEAPTDPQMREEAEDVLREFQRSINQTRRDAGSRILYPDVE